MNPFLAVNFAHNDEKIDSVTVDAYYFNTAHVAKKEYDRSSMRE